MRLSIMQPYLFPYLGYFQLLAGADAFVLHDDVQYIKGGWINRNCMLFEGAPRRFSLPVARAASSARINEREYAATFTDDKQKLIRQLQHSYSKAPRYTAVMELINACLASSERNVARFNAHVLRSVADFLGIATPIRMSSALDIEPGLRGEDRVLRINRLLGATHYVNPPWGRDLYDHSNFEKSGLKLSFLESEVPAYPQFEHEFVPNLSIIDALMFNPSGAYPDLLSACRLTR